MRFRLIKFGNGTRDGESFLWANVGATVSMRELGAPGGIDSLLRDVTGKIPAVNDLSEVSKVNGKTKTKSTTKTRTRTKTTPSRSSNFSATWPPFAQKLADALEKLVEDQYLILSVKQSDRFIQFAAQGSLGIRVETTSNNFLTKQEKLDERQIAALIKAGWHAPTGDPAGSTPENDPDGSLNFFVEFSVPVSFGAVAELTVRTFSEILRVPHSGSLQYEAFDNSEGEWEAMALPGLGLKQEKPAPQADNRDLTYIKEERMSKSRRKVMLRSQQSGANSRNLWAYLDAKGNLHIDGQDLGPSTGIVSSDGEYEWFQTIKAKDIVRLVHLLGGVEGCNILDLLEERWTGRKASKLEQLLRESDIPVDLHTWSG